ncbi:MAG: hypothetical protein A2133_09510 [Actinobacteria bacterium RBG_16_64_13]|nr:MAG: hypothetical protein A2133_09510 [Actinobacteria bacterium RBG_16_64_13]
MTGNEEESSTKGLHVCPAKHAGWLTISLRKAINNPTRILRGLAKTGYTVVDLGCGPGYFSLPLAEMVGGTGQVIAVDLQAEMLERLRVRAEAAGLASRIRLHQCAADSLGLEASADLALAFWMLHEVPDKERFLKEVYAILNDDGRFLLVEPWGHVSAVEYRRSVAKATAAGLKPLKRVRVGFSRATLFERGDVMMAEVPEHGGGGLQ